MRQKVMNPPPPLPATWEQEPSPDRYKSHYPLNAVPYKVQDGDNFMTLAALSGMSIKALLEFNFLTTKPQTINWYLRNYVGCTTQSWDNKSYSFRSADEPGILEFPPQAYKRLMEVVTPLPIYESETWEVPGWLPQVFQGVNKWNCWAGSITAMLSYKRGAFLNIPSTMALLGQKWVRRQQDGTGVTASEYREVCQKAGLTSLDGQSPLDPFQWVKDLERNGPLMLTLNAGGNNTHVVVIYGYRFRHPSRFELLVMDPAEQHEYWEDAFTLIHSSNSTGSWWKRVRL
jgi:hypothetical protein